MATVRVPQETDEIMVSTGGASVRATVRDHIAEIPDEAVALILREIPGAEVVTETTPKAETPPTRRESTETQAQPARKEIN